MTDRSETAPLTKSILDKVIEGVAIAVVCELVVGGGEFLEALRGDSVEIPAELGELREDHRSTRHEAVDQRLLSHFCSSILPPINPRTSFCARILEMCL